MNIKILDSWLRDYLKTKATPQQIAEKLSLSSVSVERLEKIKDDYSYDIEVTTNRPELMSVIGLAIESATVLSHFGIDAEFTKPDLKLPEVDIKNGEKIYIKNDPKLVRRICAVIMDVEVKDSPQYVKDRLEASGIRSLNNLIDITNYVMREVGHPTHVFDYDRLPTKELIIRESKKGEKIQTLDDKEYELSGGDIVADNGQGEIVDLLGVMGTANSAVTDKTKRILFFIDNVEPTHIRKTSMTLGIRTEAAILNEKGLSPYYAMLALIHGIELFNNLADGRIVSNIFDIFPDEPKSNTIIVSEEKINSVIGAKIPLQKSKDILENLGFSVILVSEERTHPGSLAAAINDRDSGQARMTSIEVTVPPSRLNDISIEEDLIEEIARVYGYHNIPNTLPAVISGEPFTLEKNEFFWEDRVKDALKYWGFTEVYTYPMVSENLYEGPTDGAVTIQNPLTEDFVYMRSSLVPSLLKVVKENPSHDVIKIFEIANIYKKKAHDLPEQRLTLAVVIKKQKASFFEVKGLVEQLLTDLEIKNISWKPLERGGHGASIYSLPLLLGEGGGEVRTKVYLGDIEILDDNLINFELNFQLMLTYATLKKTYKPVSKYPPIVEDMAIIAQVSVKTGEIMELIQKQSPLIVEVSLFDKYQETRTFHVVYQSYERNLNDKEVGEIREKILKVLKEKLNARLKE